jgi:hypothetical protein
VRCETGSAVAAEHYGVELPYFNRDNLSYPAGRTLLARHDQLERNSVGWEWPTVSAIGQDRGSVGESLVKLREAKRHTVAIRASHDDGFRQLSAAQSFPARDASAIQQLPD